MKPAARDRLGGLLAILLCSNAAAADFVVGINTFSLHTESGYETVTPGIYVRTSGPLIVEAGVYRNSYGFTTYHAGIGGSLDLGSGFDAAVTVGATYGYREYMEYI
jgi:hypothetical protein